MKKKRSGKNRKNFVAIPFSNALALATLTDETVIKNDIIGTLGEGLYIISVDINVVIRDLTAGETPLFFGVAHNDLTVAEILEAINAEVTDFDDIVARERARRPVRKIGAFAGALADPIFNDGRKYRQTVKFMIGEGNTLAFFLKNQSGATLTTGAIIEYDGTIFGRWQR